jgi:hypothetical protein
MRGGNTQRAQHVGSISSSAAFAAPNRRRLTPDRRISTERPVEGRVARKVRDRSVYRRRRILAVSIILLGILALVFVAFVQASRTSEQTLPIDPNNAGPDVVLAEAAGVDLSSPVRPEYVTGLGYHPEGENLLEMSPQGRNLSGNPLFRLVLGDSAPEKIQYYVMDPARRQGPSTGALDVGAKAGTRVYAPVTGMVTAVRPDPVLHEDASVVEIRPADNPDIRVFVSLVGNIDGEVGPQSPVTAGITELGEVADSAGVLKPQLAEYTSDAGNHVTMAASQGD